MKPPESDSTPPPTPDSALDDELQFHLEQRVAEFMAQGATRQEATARARARMGDVDQLKEYSGRIQARTARRHKRRMWLSDLRIDLRQGLRQGARAPALAIVAVLTLALGIGGTTATYAAVRKLMLDPIPGVDTSRLVRISRTNAAGTFSVTPSAELADAWAAGVSSLEDVAVFASREGSVDLGAGNEALSVGVMSPNVLSVLGMAPAVGRVFGPAETDVVVLTDAVWRRRFDRRADVIGRTIAIDGRPYTVVGVLPRRFTIPFVAAVSDSDLWIPRGADIFPHVIARVRPDVPDAQLRRELETVMHSLDGEGSDGEWRAKVSHPFDDVGATTRDSLLVLFGAMAIVLLAGCANVANLLLARAQVRRHEFVIRQSLGASRGRVIRQLLTESSLLALAGWSLGLGVARGCLELVQHLRPEAFAMLDGVSLDAPLVWWSLMVAATTSLFFGMAPALFAAGRHLSGQLRIETRSATADRGARRWRAIFVMGEVALSVMLLIGAGLLVRTLVEMQRAPLGFEPAGLYRATVVIPEDRYATQNARASVFSQLLDQVQALPGMSQATWSTGVPPEIGVSVGALQIEDRDLQPEGRTFLGFNIVSPAYFGLTRTPIIEGRVFGSGAASDNEIVVSQTLAREQWPGESAVGKRLRLSSDGPWSLIVGVAGDVTIPRPGAAGRSSPVSELIYSPFTASWNKGMLLMRHQPSLDGLPGLFPALTELAAAVDPGIKI